MKVLIYKIYVTDFLRLTFSLLNFCKPMYSFFILICNIFSFIFCGLFTLCNCHTPSYNIFLGRLNIMNLWSLHKQAG